jgi:hypothetical protein
LVSSVLYKLNGPHLVQIACGAGSVKADQWRNHISVLFVGLYVAWEVNGGIPDEEAPPSALNTRLFAVQNAMEALLYRRRAAHLHSKNLKPSKAALDTLKEIKMDRSLRGHYNVMLELCAAICILASRSISPNEVRRGCSALSGACQSLARMRCHLTPYFHIVMHLEDQFYWLGPCYAWWAFAYERNNGILGQINHNGHSGSELEATLMQGWWKSILMHDLVCYFVLISFVV